MTAPSAAAITGALRPVVLLLSNAIAAPDDDEVDADVERAIAWSLGRRPPTVANAPRARAVPPVYRWVAQEGTATPTTLQELVVALANAIRVASQTDSTALAGLIARMIGDRPVELEGVPPSRLRVVMLNVTEAEWRALEDFLARLPNPVGVQAEPVADEQEPAPEVEPPTPAPVPIELEVQQNEPWRTGAPPDLLPRPLEPDQPVTIYARQHAVAGLLFDRIQRLLGGPEGRRLDQFAGVEFRISTAYINALRDQTRYRLQALRGDDVLTMNDDTTDLVLTYGVSARNVTSFLAFRASAQANPTILHVLVADECHWGATRNGWNSLYVNDTNVPDVEGLDPVPNGHLLQLPNVVVLLVSATPYNLLTARTRLPNPLDPAERDEHIVLWEEAFAQDLVCGGATLAIRLDSFARHPTAASLIRNAAAATPVVAAAASGLAPAANPARAGAFVDGDDLVQPTRNGGHFALHRVPVDSGDELVRPVLLLCRHPRATLNEVAATVVALGVQAVGAARQWLARVGTTCEVVLQPDPQNAIPFELEQGAGYGVLSFWTAGRTDVLTVSSQPPHTLSLAAADAHNQLSWQFIFAEAPKPRMPATAEADFAGIKFNTDLNDYKSLTYYFNTMRNVRREDQLIRMDADGTTPPRTKHLSNVRRFSCDYVYSILHFAAFLGMDCLSRETTQPNVEPNPLELRRRPQTWWLARHCMLRTLIATLDRAMPHLGLQAYTHGVETWGAAALEQACMGHLEACWRVLKFCQTAVEEHFDVLVQGLRRATEEAATSAWLRSRSETEILLEDLVVNNASQPAGDGTPMQMNGRMKIIRIAGQRTSIPEASEFYTAVVHAARLGGLDHIFAILRDYGRFDMADAFRTDPELARWRDLLNREDPEWTPKQYEHLNRLPCLLILVERGRMGDTFPPTFNCMDLRLSYNNDVANPAIHLSTFVQELGRLCRYAPASFTHTSLPYALVSPFVYERLTSTALPHNLTLATAFMTRPDAHMAAGRLPGGARMIPVRWSRAQPATNHYDMGTHAVVTHPRRLLLQAEPQIGKTGTFLALLRRLQDAVHHQNAAVIEYVQVPTMAVYPTLLAAGGDQEALWRMPYWDLMENYDPSVDRQRLAPSKYDAFNPRATGLPWRYGDIFPDEALQELQEIDLPVGREHVPLVIPAGRAGDANLRRAATDQLARLRQQPWEIKDPQRYQHEALGASHFGVACPDCAVTHRPGTSNNVELMLHAFRAPQVGPAVSFGGQPHCRVSVPTAYVENGYVTLSGDPMAAQPKQVVRLCSELFNTDLRYWICTPSVRPNTALLNLRHALRADGGSAPPPYAQMLVCRSESFERFRDAWGGHLLIIALPEIMITEATADDARREDRVHQGVGYARRFIQLIAEQFEMPLIVMLDDNIFHMSEVVFPLPPRDLDNRQPQRLPTRPCSLRTVLLHLQAAATGVNPASAPDMDMTPPANEAVHADRTVGAVVPYRFVPGDTVRTPLFTHAGTPDRYGAWGTFKSEFRLTSVMPFKRGHVHSLVLLNVKALAECNIRYQCWPFWEDLNLNQQMNEWGLWECKFNRFVQLKRWRPAAHPPPLNAPAEGFVENVPSALFLWPDDDQPMYWAPVRPPIPSDIPRRREEMLALLEVSRQGWIATQTAAEWLGLFAGMPDALRQRMVALNQEIHGACSQHFTLVYVGGNANLQAWQESLKFVVKYWWQHHVLPLRAQNLPLELLLILQAPFIEPTIELRPAFISHLLNDSAAPARLDPSSFSVTSTQDPRQNGPDVAFLAVACVVQGDDERPPMSETNPVVPPVAGVALVAGSAPVATVRVTSRRLPAQGPSNAPVFNNAMNAGREMSAEKRSLPVNVLHNTPDGALRLESLNGHLENVERALKNGADVHTENDEPLRLASKYGHRLVVERLLAAGADVHANNDEALHLARQYGHLTVVERLVRAVADIHADQDAASHKRQRLETPDAGQSMIASASSSHSLSVQRQELVGPEVVASSPATNLSLSGGSRLQVTPSLLAGEAHAQTARRLDFGGSQSPGPLARTVDDNGMQTDTDGNRDPALTTTTNSSPRRNPQRDSSGPQEYNVKKTFRRIFGTDEP